ncbi:hypothetical protein BT69DRAFT_1319499 [Atractiella rhizophila]|nr:hypothetical protein BT69DRAFT_1319499 [Atractiella rhizophila]
MGNVPSSVQPLTEDEQLAHRLCDAMKRFYSQDVAQNDPKFYKPMIEFLSLLDGSGDPSKTVTPRVLNTPAHDLRSLCWWACRLGNPVALCALLKKGANGMDVGLGMLWTVEGFDCESLAFERGAGQDRNSSAYRLCAEEMGKWRNAPRKYEMPIEIAQLIQELSQIENLTSDFLQDAITSLASANNPEPELVPPYAIQPKPQIQQPAAALADVPTKSRFRRIQRVRQSEQAEPDELMDFEEFDAQKTSQVSDQPVPMQVDSQIPHSLRVPIQSFGSVRIISQSTSSTSGITAPVVTSNIRLPKAPEDLSLHGSVFRQDSPDDMNDDSPMQKLDEPTALTSTLQPPFKLKVTGFPPLLANSEDLYDIFFRCSPYIFEEIRKADTAAARAHMDLKLRAWIHAGRPKFVDWHSSRKPGAPTISETFRNIVVPSVKGAITVNIDQGEAVVEYETEEDLRTAKTLFDGKKFLPSKPSSYVTKAHIVMNFKEQSSGSSFMDLFRQSA